MASKYREPEYDPNTKSEIRKRYILARREGASGEDAAAIAMQVLDPDAKKPAPKPAPPKLEHPVEPPKAAPKPAAAAEPKPQPKQQAQDDLTQINGVGSNTVKRLAELGVTSYAQIAKWSDAEAKKFDSELGLRGRIVREGWVKQAKALSK